MFRGIFRKTAGKPSYCQSFLNLYSALQQRKGAIAAVSQPNLTFKAKTFKCIKKQRPDRWQNMHVLVPVDEIRKFSEAGAKSFDLRFDFSAELAFRQLTAAGSGNDGANRRQCFCGREARHPRQWRAEGQVEMQPNIRGTLVRLKRFGCLWPRGPCGHDACRGEPFGVECRENAPADRWRKGVIIGA